MKEEDIRKRVRDKVQRLLSEGVFDDDDEDEEGEEHDQKVDKRKGIELGDDEEDKMILFDGFVEGLVNSLGSYDVSDLQTEKLSDAIQSQSLKRMFQADTQDEYYNYKTRLKKSQDIANQVMNHIQNNEEEPEQEPKFVDYNNIGYDTQFGEESDSKSQTKLANMAYEYKKMKDKEDEEGIDAFFWGKPDGLKEKIKKIGENLSMSKLREYCGGDHGLPDGVSKDDVMNEFRGKIRDKVREYFEDGLESGQDILEDFE